MVIMLDPKNSDQWANPELRPYMEKEGWTPPEGFHAKPGEGPQKEPTPVEGVGNVLKSTLSAVVQGVGAIPNTVLGFPGQVAAADKTDVQNQMQDIKGHSWEDLIPDTLSNTGKDIAGFLGGLGLTGKNLAEGAYNIPGEAQNAYYQNPNKVAMTNWSWPWAEQAVNARPLWGMAGSLTPYLAIPEANTKSLVTDTHGVTPSPLIPTQGTAMAMGAAGLQDPGQAQNRGQIRATNAILPYAMQAGSQVLNGMVKGAVTEPALPQTSNNFDYVGGNHPQSQVTPRPQSNSFTETPLLSGEGAHSIIPTGQEAIEGRAQTLKARAQAISGEAQNVNPNIETPVYDAYMAQQDAAHAQVAKQSLDAAQQIRATQEEGLLQTAKQALQAAQYLMGQEQEAQISIAKNALEAAKTLKDNEQNASIQYAKHVIDTVMQSKKSGYSLNPIEVATALGTKSIKAIEAINPNWGRSIGSYFKDVATQTLPLLHGFVEATTGLGEEAATRVADATLVYRMLKNGMISPVVRELGRIGYDMRFPDVEAENKITAMFRNSRRGDIWKGKVSVDQYGIPSKFAPALKLVDKALSDEVGFPGLLGFKGIGNYWFKQGFQRPNSPELFNLMTGGKEGPKTPQELRNSSIFYHREYEGNPLDDRSVFQAFVSHANKMAIQHAWAPLERDAQGNTVMDAKGNYQITPNSHFEWFKGITDNKEAPTAQKQWAQTILDTVVNRNTKTAVDRSLRWLQSNYLRSVLNDRISSGLKHYPTIFAQSDVPLQMMMKALTDAATDPQAQRIIAKYGPESFLDIEALQRSFLANQMASPKGLDAYNVLQQYSANVTFWGKILEESKLQNIPMDEIEQGRTERARGALRSATLAIKAVQGNWSEFDLRPNSQNPMMSWITMFRNPKLTEFENLYRWSKTKNFPQIGRYLAIKYLIGGPANIVDKGTANFMRTAFPTLPPDQQKFLEDAETGAMAMQAMQEILPETNNVSVHDSTAEPIWDTKGLPGVSEGKSTSDWFKQSVGDIQNHKPGGWAELAQPALQALPGVNVGGFHVTPALAAKAFVAHERAGMGSESFMHHDINVDPASEYMRLFFSGNTLKDQMSHGAENRSVAKKADK